MGIKYIHLLIKMLIRRLSAGHDADIEYTEMMGEVYVSMDIVYDHVFVSGPSTGLYRG